MLQGLQPLFRFATEALAEELRRSGKRRLPEILLIWAGVFCALATLVGAIITLYMYLALHWPAHQAVLLLTSGLALATLVLGALLWRILAEKRDAEKTDNPNTADKPTSSGTASDIVELATLLGVELGQSVARNPKTLTCAALAAGVAFGASPKLRAAVINAIAKDATTPRR